MFLEVGRSLFNVEVVLLSTFFYNKLFEVRKMSNSNTGSQKCSARKHGSLTQNVP
jgi:hypothetical protein